MAAVVDGSTGLAPAGTTRWARCGDPFRGGWTPPVHPEPGPQSRWAGIRGCRNDGLSVSVRREQESALSLTFSMVASQNPLQARPPPCGAVDLLQVPGIVSGLLLGEEATPVKMFHWFHVAGMQSVVHPTARKGRVRSLSWRDINSR